MSSLKVIIATTKVCFMRLHALVFSQSATTKPLKRLLMDSVYPFSNPFQPLCLNIIYQILKGCLIHLFCCCNGLHSNAFDATFGDLKVNWTLRCFPISWWLPSPVLPPWRSRTRTLLWWHEEANPSWEPSHSTRRLSTT